MASAPAFALQWEVKEATHPLLGPIRFAYLVTPVTTAVGKVQISSRAYVSCEKSSNKIAIEIAHGASANDPNGLPPKTVPRLMCKMVARGGKKVEPQEIPARWGINELGDVLARGLAPSQLRQCASIEVEQDVALPVAPATARVQFEINPYLRELDSIFVTCGEQSASAPPAATAATTAPAASAPPVAPAVAPTAAVSPPLKASPQLGTADPRWKSARTIAGSKTNVRAGPSTSSALVKQLEGGANVLVFKEGSGDWWHAKAASGKPFDGYIREDRLIVK